MVGPYRLKDFGLRLPESVEVLDVDDLATAAAASRLLDEAEARAAAIEAAAREVYESERRRGLEDGRRLARQEAVAALIAETRQLDAALVAIEADLVAVVLTALRKIVDGFDDVARAEALVRAGLRRLRKARRAELHLPRALAADLKPRIQALVAELPDVEHLELIESDALTGSNIVLEASIGRVEGDIGIAVAEIEDLLRHALGRRLALERIAAVEAQAEEER